MRTKLDVWNFKNYLHILQPGMLIRDSESYKYSIMQTKKKPKNIVQGQVNYQVEYIKLLNKYSGLQDRYMAFLERELAELKASENYSIDLDMLDNSVN